MQIDEELKRIGLRIKPNKRSTLLLSYLDNENSEIQDQAETYVEAIDFRYEQNSVLEHEGSQLEGQYIYQGDSFNLIAGLSESNADRDTEFYYEEFLGSY